jgi:flavin reductase (DIM6/NTAB) family NADH-FMN oxidoreductase RutF
MEVPVTATSLVDADLFRALLRRHAAAVVVITAPGEPPAGFTATSFTSVPRRGQVVEAGDHSIVLAAPEEGRHHDDLSATPLVYHDGHYANIQGAS